MVSIVTGREALRRLFAGLTEYTFQAELGVVDPPLVDYLSKLLEKFVRMDAIFRVRDILGKRLEQVAEMLMEAEERHENGKREIHRHIGDFTLFWTGVYPEQLARLTSTDQQDHLLNYFEEGKRAYYIASTFEDERYSEEAPVLRRLSEEFELCTYGLTRVRQEWEKLSKDPSSN